MSCSAASRAFLAASIDSPPGGKRTEMVRVETVLGSQLHLCLPQSLDVGQALVETLRAPWAGCGPESWAWRRLDAVLPVQLLPRGAA